MDYGKTLHLPETEFPMRGNLPKREPEILKFWEDNKIYQKRLELRKDAKPFILHDGPPYANGKLHIGHALNKTLKDIIMKYKTMTGHYTRYIPGWGIHTVCQSSMRLLKTLVLTVMKWHHWTCATNVRNMH